MDGISRSSTEGVTRLLFNQGVMVADGEVPPELCTVFPNLTSFVYYVGTFRGNLSDTFANCKKLTELTLSPSQFISNVRELDSRPPRLLPASLNTLHIEDANIDFVKYGIPTECKTFLRFVSNFNYFSKKGVC